MSGNKAPKKVGGYAIEGVLGKGGMGEVYLGRHELLERPVAIKRLQVVQGADPAMLEERFKREGKALAALSHHGIVAVHDLFTHRGDLYMVLEYVDGLDLSRLLERGPFPVDVAAMIALKMAEALEHAHFHRIIHRDIKPANVMVSRKGEVKLMDFGIARDETLDGLTKTGHLVGTPMFMAPEVVTGGTADERSDIYAVGATLYQMLSGRRLFEHATAENLFALIAAGKYPKLHKVWPGIPRAMRRIVERCLERKPEKRYPTAADLRQDLETFLTQHHAWARSAERLMAFLAARGEIEESEALTVIEADELITQSNVAVHGTSRWPRAALAVAAGALLALGAAAWAQGWLDGVWAKVAGQVGAAEGDSDRTQAAPEER